MSNLFCWMMLAGIDVGQAQTGAPHRLQDISVLPDNFISLTFNGSASSTFRALFDMYVLETSSNLVDWSCLPTLTRTNASTNTLVYVEQIPPNSPRRFYRTYTNQLVTPFPAPAGPFSVGTFSRLISDPSRTNRYNIKTNSSFMIQVWYPAQAVPGLLPGPWLAPAVAQDAAQALASLYGVSMNIRQLVEQAIPGAPMNLAAAACPICFFDVCSGYQP